MCNGGRTERTLSRHMDLGMWRVVGALVSALMLSRGALGFNLDTKSAVVYRGNSGSMFGFSVTLFKDRGSSWILAGAPKAETNQPNVTSGGAVYRCSTESAGSCTAVPFDTTGPNYKYINNRIEYTDIKSNQWFGATVDASHENGLVVACAPRYVYFSINFQRREPVGTCWIGRNSLATFQEYSPCKTPAWGFHRQGFCQAGFSAALTENGQNLFVGAVGSWYWQGQVFSKDLISNQEHKTSESPPTYDDSFLGYSSAIGEFSGDSDMDIVAGMPRGNNLTGKVVLFNSTLHNLLNISGEQIGSYFGYSVCVSDVDGDGLDDIVVGAPLFTDLQSKESKYEEGRVYVYYQDSKHYFETRNNSVLDGTYVRGRFGLSLASLKDINQDGYEDFAVGAPYAGKNGRGIVYIYHGSSTGIRDKPSQVITPDDFADSGLRTLGFAVSGGMDMDSNDYPDIVIGAYDSDRAIFMRSRPVVNITSSLKLSRYVINLEDKMCSLKDNTKVACINAKLCMKFSGIGVASEIDISYTIMLDAKQKGSRALFLGDEAYQLPNKTHYIRLKKNVQYCNASVVYIQNGIRDKLSPVEIRAAYELIDLEPYRYFLKPILNLNVPTYASKEVHIEKNCGEDDVCVPELQLLASPNMKQYSIGSTKRLELEITIRNAGEDAFESMLYVVMPLDMSYVKIGKSKLDYPVDCTGARPEVTGVNELKCDVGNPLPANKTLNFKIILEPSRIVSSATDLIFTMIVNSTNPEKNETMLNNYYEIELPVRVEVSLAVRGVPFPPVVPYNKSEEISKNKVRETDIGPEVTHVYEIGNQGPSSVKQAEVYILWPTYTLEGKPLLYIMSQPDIRGNVICNEFGDVNPFNLKVIDRRPRNKTLTVEDMRYSLLNDLSYKNDYEDKENSRKRHKRDEEEEEALFMADESEDHYLGEKGEGAFLEELSCGPTLCTKLNCTISNLEKGDQVVFTIRSRLWRETYNEFGLKEVKTSSKLVARITSLPYDVDPSYLPYKIHEVSTIVSLEDIALQPYMIPWWIIILAICCGLILLGLLALLLWKLGFFKRKRPEELPEKEPLNERNGYRMTAGDAAL